MKKINKKNVLIYFSTMMIFFTLLSSKIDKNKTTISDDIDGSYELYSTYENGNVYFCDSLSIAECLVETCDESDVIIVDQCEFKDPNMKILSSYKIVDKNIMKEILAIIKEYCDSKESDWNRSIESMENEWIVHNIFSNLSIKKDSTDDVDLNNSDEDVYSSKIISKILGN